jgi:pyrroloquinoline quinone (PQQ) biosynthesis protein C
MSQLMRDENQESGTADHPQKIVERFERLEVRDHPLFKDLARAPVDLGALWLIVANVQEGVSRDFVTCLAMTVARVADRRVGSLVAKQLDDELGHGDPSRIHSLLLGRFVAALDRHRLALSDDEALAPGRRLAEQMVAPFYAHDPYEGVGALMAGEIFARKMDFCLGDEFRRQTQLSAEEMLWLTIHEQLEIDHADDSGSLAELLPRQAPTLAAAWRGAEAQWACLWAFLDDLQKVRMQVRRRSSAS